MTLVAIHEFRLTLYINSVLNNVSYNSFDPIGLSNPVNKSRSDLFVSILFQGPLPGFGIVCKSMESNFSCLLLRKTFMKIYLNFYLNFGPLWQRYRKERVEKLHIHIRFRVWSNIEISLNGVADLF